MLKMTNTESDKKKASRPEEPGAEIMISTLSHKSKSKGIGGEIKASPEDFLVEEILQDGTVLEINSRFQQECSDGNYVRFALQKREWTTEGAIRRIAKALRISPRRFSYTGSKDKMSVSTQLASAFQADKERLTNLKLKDIRILGAWRHPEKVRIGDLLGNRFTITARNLDDNADETVREIYHELDGLFPNYFGAQRFGTTRGNNHTIGEQIVRGRCDAAAMMFLCDYHGETNEEAIIARKHLSDTGDFKKALAEFPKHLRLERTMIAHLQRYPRDYANAFRKLPRGISLLFIHAFQSNLFNTLLSERIAEGGVVLEDGEHHCSERLGFPDIGERSPCETCWIVGKIIGYDTRLNEREKELLERLGLKQEDFEIKNIPEMSSKGTRRLLLAPMKGFSFGDDTFRFSLPAGSYATVALREFMDRQKTS